MINDPGCCTPGSEGCPARSLEETYGFDWCPGDEELLKFVGKDGYRDPACDFKDAPVDANDPHHKDKDQRQSSCDLAFGTSTGALGFRKFPNPRFDKERWLKVNGSLASWEGFDKRMSERSRSRSDSRDEPSRRRLDRAAVPHRHRLRLVPHRVRSAAIRPRIRRIRSGRTSRARSATSTRASPRSSLAACRRTTLEYQVFAHARPGTSDTSAIPTDQVNNPGTMNAIINIKQRPTFHDEVVNKWRKVESCAKDDAEDACWCEPGRDGKCWQKSTQTETVHHILKGGEDSIGALEAIQRVYFNIGSCSEQCWVNHLTDLRQLDPQGRNFGQTPFDIGQCRRDCPNFRAIEDRLPNILDFLLSHGELRDRSRTSRARSAAQGEEPQGRLYGYDDLVADLDKQFGKGAVVARARGVRRQIARAATRASPRAAGGPFKARDFRALDPKTGLRADWMGNDQATLVSEVGTFRCRALHSNHMAGHVWQEYGSETLRARVHLIRI